jgi:hypothetical protein
MLRSQGENYHDEFSEKFREDEYGLELRGKLIAVKKI